MTHLSRIFKITLATVLRNHAGILVQPQQIPDTIEEVRQVLKEAGYIATLKIATGLHLAYLEYKPLLLEGPPGTGKTFLAQTVAKARGLPIIRIQCYEGITFESLIGHWNFQKQVLAIRAKDETQLQNVYTPEFFRKGPLFSAFAKKGEDNVLLIDEFDKADDVFEYFFTEYLDERQLSTPELGTIKQQNKSYVFITSNMRRGFDEATLRRCLYLYIPYPDKETEMAIIRKNVPTASNYIAKQVVTLVRILRLYELEKTPSPVEAIEFTRAFLRIESELITQEILKQLLSILSKTKSDNDFILQNLEQIFTEFMNRLEQEELPTEVPLPEKEPPKEPEKEAEAPPTEEVEEVEEVEEEKIEPGW